MVFCLMVAGAGAQTAGAAAPFTIKGRNLLVVLPQETAVLWAGLGLDLPAEVIEWLDKNPATGAR